MIVGVLVDSSVLIDFFNHTQPATEEVVKLRELFQNGIPVYICPAIYQEVLQGIREEKDFAYIKCELDKMHILLSEFPEAEDLAIELYRSLRKKGLTIRKSNDCLIAAHAILAGIPILFKDKDFEFLCKHTELKAY